MDRNLEKEALKVHQQKGKMVKRIDLFSKLAPKVIKFSEGLPTELIIIQDDDGKFQALECWSERGATRVRKIGWLTDRYLQAGEVLKIQRKDGTGTFWPAVKQLEILLE